MLYCYTICIYNKEIASLLIVAFFRRSTNGDWETGNFHGVLFTSHDVITKNTYVITHKYGRQRSTLFSGSDEQFGGDSSKKVDKGHTFLTLTFTRALRKNVKKRLKLADGDSHAFGGQSGIGMLVFWIYSICTSYFSVIRVMR